MKIIEIVEKQRDKEHAVYSITIDKAQAKVLADEAKRTLAVSGGIKLVPAMDLDAELARRFTEKEIDEFVSDYVGDRVCPFVITEKQLPVAFEPRCHLSGKLDGSEDLHIRATMTFNPTFALSSYGPVSVVIPSIEVTPGEIEDEILRTQQMAAELIDIEEDRPLKDSDLLQADITTRYAANGQEVSSLCGEKCLVDLSQQMVPEEFKKQVLSMKPGETKSFSYETPEFDAEGRSHLQMVDTTVTLYGPKQMVLPDIDDAWVKEHIRGCSTLDDFKALIERELVSFKKEQNEDVRSNAVDAKLAERLVGVIPDEIFEASQKNLTSMLQHQLAAEHRTLAQHLQESGLSEDQWRMQTMMEIRSMLRSSYALDALFTELELEITDADRQECLERMAPGHADEALKELTAASRLYSLDEVTRRYAAHRWLLETANIEYQE
jgi:trigger factor